MQGDGVLRRGKSRNIRHVSPKKEKKELCTFLQRIMLAETSVSLETPKSFYEVNMKRQSRSGRAGSTFLEGVQGGQEPDPVSSTPEGNGTKLRKRDTVEPDNAGGIFWESSRNPKGSQQGKQGGHDKKSFASGIALGYPIFTHAINVSQHTSRSYTES